MDGSLLATGGKFLRRRGVREEAGRFGDTSFRYGKREIGHVHRDDTAGLPVTPGEILGANHDRAKAAERAGGDDA